MQINYNVTGEKRKSLVGAIGQELNAPIKYLGAPTFAYEVGGYHIDKTGILTGDDNPELVADIQGLHDFKAITEDYDTPIQEPEQGDALEANHLTIEMPRSAFTDIALENLRRLIESKSSLIVKALGNDGITIIIGEETVSFPWFQGELTSDEVKAYTCFVTALCEMAKTQQRVNGTEKQVENEKYAFRCFLLRLGFVGAEYKTERKILLKNLSGNSAFKNGAPTKAEEVMTNE